MFQHGPHTWAGVKVISKPGGGKGVAFHGLGNFLHPGCKENPDNLIGRALFDVKTLKLKQVQVIPVVNHYGEGVTLRPKGSRFPVSNVKWIPTTFQGSPTVHAAFANVD